MTVKLFTATSNISCQKAIEWLNKYEIPYEEKNLSTVSITIEEIQEILSLTTEGTEEIISKKAQAVKKLKVEIDINTLSLSQFYEVIMKNPEILHLPIIHGGKKIQVGYNEEEIRKFLPRSFRLDEFRKIMSSSSKEELF